MKKAHLIILIALTLLTVLYFVARSKAPVEKENRFFSADSAQVYKLEFSTPEDTVIIVRDKSEWRMTYPLEWAVSEDQLGNFFRQALPIKTSLTPMSEDPSLQSMYKVEEKSAVRVKIYGKSGRLLDHVFIGNGSNTSYDYGRKDGDKKIYQFKINITNFVRPDVYLWRSPNITNLKRADIDRIDVTYTLNAYTLTLVGDSIRYTDKRESFMIPEYNRAQDKIINALEHLMTWQFVDSNTEQYAQAFRKPDCKIVVHLKNGKAKTFTLIRKDTPITDAPPNSPQQSVLVLMMIDDKMTPLYQMTGDFINRFTRASQHFKVIYD